MLRSRSLASILVALFAAACALPASAAAVAASMDGVAPIAFAQPQQSSLLRAASPSPASSAPVATAPVAGNANSVTEAEKLAFEYAIAAEQLKELVQLTATTKGAAASVTPTPSPKSNSAQQGPIQQGPIQQNPNKPAKRCSLEIPHDHLVSLRCNSDRIRFIGLGDWGETFESTAVLAVRDSVLRDAKTGNYDFILAVGDNFYANGVQNVTDSQWKTTWFDRFRIGTELTLPWISFLGNHDHYGKIEAQIAYGLSDGLGAKYWIMPSKFYSIDAKVSSGEKVKFVIPDTMTLNWTNDAPWITQEFNDPKASFVFAAGHHHIYSAGGRGDNKDANVIALNQLIQSTPSVKGFLGGHEHDMQYMRASGKDYFMFGGGGRTIKEETRPGTAADTIFYAKKYGYSLFDIDVANRVVSVTYHVFNASGVEIDEISFKRRY